MDIFETDDNSTPLTSDEKDGLKLKWITLRSELNEVETRNLLNAQNRLVQIHPFPNGNGRVSRIMADLLSEKLTGEKLNWEICNLSEISEIRKQYTSALRQADAGNYADLLNFVKSRN